MRNYFSNLFQLICVVASFSPSTSQDPECAGLKNEFFVEEGGDGLPFWLRWTVNINSTDPSKSTLTMQYEVTKQAWVAFGIAKTDGMMEGAEAVIGAPGNNTVLKYNLFMYGVTVMPEEKQTLMDTSIVQDDTGTILTYTKYLEEEGELPIVPGMVLTLGASGMDNNVGYHGPSSRGGAPFPFFADCIDGVVVTSAPTAAPAPTPTASPVASGSGSHRMSRVFVLACSLLAVGSSFV